MNLSSTFSTTVRRAQVVRTLDFVQETSAAEVGVMIRFLVLAIVLTSAVGVYLWSRMEVPSLAVELDRARSELGRAEVAQARMRVELATIRQPGRLQAGADRLGLVPPVALVMVSLPSEAAVGPDGGP